MEFLNPRSFSNEEAEKFFRDAGEVITSTVDGVQSSIVDILDFAGEHMKEIGGVIILLALLVFSLTALNSGRQK